MNNSKIQDNIANACIDILNRNDIKCKIKEFFSPVIDLVLLEIYPYIYLSLIFIIICFLLILGIFILLMRNKLVIK